MRALHRRPGPCNLGGVLVPGVEAHMSATIAHAETDEQSASTFEVMRQLRPHLAEADYVASIRSLMASEGLRLLVPSEGGCVRAVATFEEGRSRLA